MKMTDDDNDMVDDADERESKTFFNLNYGFCVFLFLFFRVSVAGWFQRG